jgi:hypothetical protein
VSYTDEHISSIRLADIARDPSEKRQSEFEKRHLNDCVVCLRDLVDMMNAAFRRQQQKRKTKSA